MSAAKELPSSFKLATVWLLVLTLGFLGFQAFERQRQQSRFELNGQEIVLKRAPDGHFHWRGRIQGHSVDFMVDTGASRTALPAALARELGLETSGVVRSSTAGGVVDGSQAHIDLELAGGVQARQLRVTVLPQLDVPLLGMDVLSRLSFTQQAGELRIAAAR